MSHVQHRAEAPPNLRCFVLTVSDTRTEATDTGGRAIADLLTSNGHQVTARAIVRDEPAQVSLTLQEHLAEPGLDAIITTGGTGITSRDGTFEAVSALLEKTLVGFGEIFRMLSYQEIGPAAMLSRATAGLARRKIVIALPGSEHAVRLAMTKLILPELGHMVREARK
jgi:molybdenum cofactor biosynthesis protein B